MAKTTRGKDKPVLDLRGLGGFIPYWSIEDLVKKTGEVTVNVDDAVERLLEIWAKRRGYSVERMGKALLHITIGASVSKPPEEIIKVSEDKWDNDLSSKLADISRIVEIVLKAPIIYRGRFDPEEIANAIRRPGTLLVRLHMGASDYFFVSKGSEIIAAARLGVPLSPQQARSLFEAAMRDKDVSVTVYDVSSVTV